MNPKTTKEAVSFDDIRQAIMRALEVRFPPNKLGTEVGITSNYCYIEEVYPGSVIYERNGKHYKLAYTLKGTEVTLGEKEVEVTETWKPVKESIRITELLLTGLVGLSLQEADDGTPYIRGATLIEPGESKNKNVHVGAVLSRDGPSVFEGLPIYATNHNPADKNIRNLIAVSENVRYEGERLVGDLRGMKSEKALLEKALEASQVMGSDRVGLSIDARADAVMKQTARGRVREITRYIRDPKNSVDLVMNPSAGGRLTESLTEESEVKEKLSQLTEAVLSAMNTATVQFITESLTDEEIREANPGLAVSIIAKRDEKAEGNPKVEPAPKTTVQEARTGQEDIDRIAESVDAKVEARIRLMECRQSLAEALNTAKLSPLGCELISAKFSGVVFESADLDKEIRRVRDEEAKLNPRLPRVPGSGGSDVQVTEAYDKNVARLYGATTREPQILNGQQIQPFRTITEAILAFEPDRARDFVTDPEFAAREALPLFAWDGGPLERAAGRVQEATGISTSSFTTAWADVLNRSLRASVSDPELGVWRALVSRFIPFRDLTNTHKIIRVGELGTAPTVAEGAPYQYTNRPTDDQETVSIAKKGFLHDVTWEAILREDLGVLTRIPRDFARSFNWTIYDGLFSILQQNSGTGPTMGADATTLYHANHANIASSTFSAANLETVRRKLPVQTDPDSGKRKAYRARFLLYQSPELDQSIWETLASDFKIPPTITNAGETNLPNYIKSVLNLTPIPVIYPTTTTTRWELVADPMDAETFAVGFLGGKDSPDVFIQDMETVGARFTADKVTYKLRFTFGASVIDWRAFSRGNV